MARRFASSTEQEIEKLLKQKYSENKRRLTKIAKELFHEYLKSVQKPEECIIKQLLDSVFAISGVIKVSVSVTSLSLRLRLITVTSTLIIPDIAKTSSNNCL